MTLNLDKSAWKRVAFGDVIENVTERVDDPASAGVDRYVGLEHLNPGVMTVQRWDTPDKVAAQKLRFQPGDVIFGRRRAYQKKVALAEFEGICSAHALVLRARPDYIDPAFLPVFLSSDYFLDRAIEISVGSLSPTVNWRDLKVQEFDLPPLDEQKRIADLLWAVQRDSESSAASLAAVDQLVDLWMRDASWVAGAERVVLSDLVEHSIGGVWGKDPETSELDVAVIRGTDISIGGEIQFAAAPPRSIKLTEARSRILQNGDVLVEKSGGSPNQPVGKVGLVREVVGDMVPSNFVLLMRPDQSRCEPAFIFSLLRGMWRHGGFAEFTGKTTNIANLRTKELLASIVRLPGRDIQRRLATELDELERLRTDLSSALRASLSLRSSLLSAIFGGN